MRLRPSLCFTRKVPARWLPDGTHRAALRSKTVIPEAAPAFYAETHTVAGHYNHNPTQRVRSCVHALP